MTSLAASSSIVRWTPWLALLSLFIASATLLISGSPTEGVAMLAFLAISGAVYRAFSKDLPLMTALFVVSMFLNSLGWVFEFYADVPGFDEIAHGLTTMTITGLAGWFLFRRLLKAGLGREFGFAVVSLGIAIGALWEAIEWFSSATRTFTRPPRTSRRNT